MDVDSGTVFSGRWLRRREPVDHRARQSPAALALARRFAAAVRPRLAGPLIDLGGGTGSNIRFLAPLVGGRQRWLLLDRDPALLRAAPPAFGAETADPIPFAGQTFRCQTFQCTIDPQIRDLVQPVLPAGPLAGIACAAFLDLVSAAWCDGLAAALARAGRPPVLCSLTASGPWSWTPADPDDGRMNALLAADMQRDKGFGQALGQQALARAEQAFATAGYRVRGAPSDWRLSPGHELTSGLLAVCAGVIARQAPDDDRLLAWRRRRQTRPASLTVPHRELLALPEPFATAGQKTLS